MSTRLRMVTVGLTSAVLLGLLAYLAHVMTQSESAAVSVLGHIILWPSLVLLGMALWGAYRYGRYGYPPNTTPRP